MSFTFETQKVTGTFACKKFFIWLLLYKTFKKKKEKNYIFLSLKMHNLLSKSSATNPEFVIKVRHKLNISSKLILLHQSAMLHCYYYHECISMMQTFNSKQNLMFVFLLETHSRALEAARYGSEPVFLQKKPYTNNYTNMNN